LQRLYIDPDRTPPPRPPGTGSQHGHAETRMAMKASSPKRSGTVETTQQMDSRISFKSNSESNPLLDDNILSFCMNIWIGKLIVNFPRLHSIFLLSVFFANGVDVRIEMEKRWNVQYFMSKLDGLRLKIKAMKKN